MGIPPLDTVTGIYPLKCPMRHYPETTITAPLHNRPEGQLLQHGNGTMAPNLRNCAIEGSWSGFHRSSRSGATAAGKAKSVASDWFPCQSAPLLAAITEASGPTDERAGRSSPRMLLRHPPVPADLNDVGPQTSRRPTPKTSFPVNSPLSERRH